MNRVRFLGVGLPPRACPCGTCGRMLAVDAHVYQSSAGWQPALFCSPQCYAAQHPHDPDVAGIVAAPTEEPPPAAAPPADDDATDSW